MAWHPIGWKTSFVSEIDPFPRAVLQHHYPDTPIHGDFTTIEANQYDPIDLLVGGTPCQSFSVAGLRRGLGDDRGNLSLEYLRLADRLRPRWLVWENVPGVLSSNGGRDFGAILGGMVELGYGFAYRVLDAQYVRTLPFPWAVPQRRRRVFVVGYLGDWRRAAAVLFDRESLYGHPPPRREAGQNAAPTLAARSRAGGGLGTDFDCDGGLMPVAIQERAVSENPDSGPDGAGVRVDGAEYTLEARTVPQALAFAQNSRDEVRLQGGDGLIAGALAAESGMKQTTYLAHNWAVRRLTPRECERLQGFPDDFTNIPWRGKNGAPDGRRYKALGNSMAVNVMRWIGDRIALVEGLDNGHGRAK